MNTYVVGFTPEAGAVRTMTFLADRVEYPVAEDRYIKFYDGVEFVGSANMDFVYMVKKEPAAAAH